MSNGSVFKEKQSGAHWHTCQQSKTKSRVRLRLIWPLHVTLRDVV
jgi:hypothetical protein